MGKPSLESVLKARQALQIQRARFDKEEAAAVSFLNQQLRPLGVQIKRVEPSAPTVSVDPPSPPHPRRRGSRQTAKAVRCPVARCGRTFHYPMHLGRHLRTVHGKKG